MSQTPTQRRREIDDARRRNLNTTIERLASEQPKRRALADQVAGSIAIFGSDELELFESICCSVVLAHRLGDDFDVLVALAAVVSRLLRGRASYGELTIDSDPRDWALERDEEMADAIVYEAIGALQSRRSRGLRSNAALLNTFHTSALANVGAHVQHSTLAARIQSVRDRERPEPFVIPPPWCLGSALLFSLLCLRIEANTIAALRCHQCGHEWTLASTELRITGSGQYVIPTHKPAPDWRSLPAAETEPTR